jgi:hypothetical protein
MENVNVVIASIRALVNEIENVKALAEEVQDETHHLYQSDLEHGLNELISIYSQHCEADPQLTEWRQLIAHFERNRWPVRVDSK